MSISLDACEILNHLNNLGYRNITAEQLKEFMKDLKRLIKYEATYSTPLQTISTSNSNRNDKHLVNTFEKLHITSTVASRAKSRFVPEIQSTGIPNKLMKKNIPQQIDKENDKPKCCTCPKNDKENKELLENPHTERAQSQCSNKSTQATNTKTKLIRNTPTDLYQFYQQDWNRFKSFLPGETSRSGVRSAVHKKMEIKPPPKPKVFLKINHNHDLHKEIKWQ